jgi:alkanesulfonate monooxygenase SsuD/methylene tetrahydromethanopterin reductase-like flavin-dependent oxidoreductase (luciferase family)
MRIGLVIGLHDGGADGEPAPGWGEIRDQAIAAERAGFDLVVLEDALTFAGRGHWESMTIAGGVAATTTRIGIGHSVVNAPLRPAAVVARAADTLDEISNGRYTLGIGAGNTPADYEEYGIIADPRYSRFAEHLEVIHGLLKRDGSGFEGDFETARPTRYAPRGPRDEGPPIVVAAGGPKMLRLCARFGDGWNWWGAATGRPDHLPPIIDELVAACRETDRDPSTLERSLDIYSVDPLGTAGNDPPAHVLGGTPEQLAEAIFTYRAFDIDEVRVDVVAPQGGRVDAVVAMADVVRLVHAG